MEVMFHLSGGGLTSGRLRSDINDILTSLTPAEC